MNECISFIQCILLAVLREVTREGDSSECFPLAVSLLSPLLEVTFLTFYCPRTLHHFLIPVILYSK